MPRLIQLPAQPAGGARPTRTVGRAALLGLACLLLVIAVIAGGHVHRQNPTVLAVDPWVGLVVGLVALAIALVALLVRRRRPRGHQPV